MTTVMRRTLYMIARTPVSVWIGKAILNTTAVILIALSNSVLRGADFSFGALVGGVMTVATFHLVVLALWIDYRGNIL